LLLFKFLYPVKAWQVVEITLHGIAQLDFQILDRLTMRMDAKTQRRSGRSTRSVFENLKDDYCEGSVPKDLGRNWIWLWGGEADRSSHLGVSP
jgi:hypothetical protein